MNKPDEATKKAIREQNPRSRLIEEEAIELFLFVRPPASMEWQQYRAQAADPETRYRAQKTLIAFCAIQPKGDELASYFEEYPGAVETCIVELSTLAGVSNKATTSKL